MIVVAAKAAIQAKYPADANRVLAAIAALGAPMDASQLSPPQIRKLIDQHDPGRMLPVCLIGGYDLVPAFAMENPTRNASLEVDHDVLTDAPYGARAGDPAEDFLPTRAVSRIPDAGPADAGAFIKLLASAAAAPATPTPPGSFEQAAKEFEGSAQLVHQELSTDLPVRFSPLDRVGAPAVQGLLSGRGRVHILLHGADQPPRWDTLWGAESDVSPLRPAVKVIDLANSTMTGAIVSFSSCYSAMLDRRNGSPPRAPDNQAALACLAAGAKSVYGSTRANWIDNTAPFDSFGSALIAAIWRQLHRKVPAAEALRKAKFAYARDALARDAWSRPYVLKTLLQAQCYGHPLATL